MATQLVPFNSAMQLGSGFNSFTQTLCVDNAVVRETDLQISGKEDDARAKSVAQSVIFKTSVINKTTDVTDEMKVQSPSLHTWILTNQYCAMTDQRRVQHQVRSIVRRWNRKLHQHQQDQRQRRQHDGFGQGCQPDHLRSLP
jgi:hypothetical protein